MKKEDRWDDDSDITLKRDFLDKKIDGVSYIKSLIRVKKVGNIYTALCPFHNEKTESLRIYPEGFKNSDGKPQDHTSWFCFGCKKGGDIVKFEELYFDLDNAQEACNSLSRKFHLDYSGDNELSELQSKLDEIKKSDEKIMSLQEINFICSIACRNYLHFVLEKHPDIFNNEYNKIQMVYKKLDEQLLKSNAYQAQKFIKITQNTIKKYKKCLTHKDM